MVQGRGSQEKLQGDVQHVTLGKVYIKSSSLRKIVEDLNAVNHCLLIDKALNKENTGIV